MGKIISIANIKGGVAKTTTAANLGVGLSMRGYKVLMIDTDPQGNLSLHFLKEDDERPNLRLIYESFRNPNGKTLKDIKVPIRDNVDLVTSDFDLCMADTEFGNQIGSFSILTKALEEVRNDYDYIIIDTSHYLGLLTINALRASDYVITPINADLFSKKATTYLHKILDAIKTEMGKTIPVLGLVITKYQKNTLVSRVAEETIQNNADILGTKCFETRIRNATVVAQSQLMQKSIYEVPGNPEVAKDYENLVDEILDAIKKQEEK